MSRRVSFTVPFEIPERATRADCVAYLLDAVGTMKGCYMPADEEGDGHPMQPLDQTTIVVTDGRQKFTLEDGV